MKKLLLGVALWTTTLLQGSTKIICTDSSKEYFLPTPAQLRDIPSIVKLFTLKAAVANASYKPKTSIDQIPSGYTYTNNNGVLMLRDSKNNDVKIEPHYNTSSVKHFSRTSGHAVKVFETTYKHYYHHRKHYYHDIHHGGRATPVDQEILPGCVQQ